MAVHEEVAVALDPELVAQAVEVAVEPELAVHEEVAVEPMAVHEEAALPTAAHEVGESARAARLEFQSSASSLAREECTPHHPAHMAPLSPPASCRLHGQCCCASQHILERLWPLNRKGGSTRRCRDGLVSC